MRRVRRRQRRRPSLGSHDDWRRRADAARAQATATDAEKALHYASRAAREKSAEDLGRHLARVCARELRREGYRPEALDL
jgi:hypothetical protein